MSSGNWHGFASALPSPGRTAPPAHPSLQRRLCLRPQGRGRNNCAFRLGRGACGREGADCEEEKGDPQRVFSKEGTRSRTERARRAHPQPPARRAFQLLKQSAMDRAAEARSLSQCGGATPPPEPAGETPCRRLRLAFSLWPVFTCHLLVRSTVILEWGPPAELVAPAAALFPNEAPL